MLASSINSSVALTNLRGWEQSSFHGHLSTYDDITMVGITLEIKEVDTNDR